MPPINFTKMHGLGNDFMVIDNLDGTVVLAAERIKELADRRTGIGFDQMLVVEKPTIASAEFDYRIYNSDGGEVEHCGNGARCFARFVQDRGLTTSKVISVNTSGGLITLKTRENGDVTVNMGIPQFSPDKIPFVADTEADVYELEVDGQRFSVGSVSIGNPHVLLQVKDINTAPVTAIGPFIETHTRFPNRVNVGFMQRVDSSNIFLRVFERGVGETRACGTGACAAVAIGHRQGLLDKNVNVTLPGGSLNIVWPNYNKSIEMTGACSTVFEGQTRM